MIKQISQLQQKSVLIKSRLLSVNMIKKNGNLFYFTTQDGSLIGLRIVVAHTDQGQLQSEFRDSGYVYSECNEKPDLLSGLVFMPAPICKLVVSKFWKLWKKWKKISRSWRKNILNCAPLIKNNLPLACQAPRFWETGEFFVADTENYIPFIFNLTDALGVEKSPQAIAELKKLLSAMDTNMKKSSIGGSIPKKKLGVTIENLRKFLGVH